MSFSRAEDRPRWHRSRLWRLPLALLAMISFIALGVALEHKAGIPFATTYRVGCAATCLLFILKIGTDYPGERWPRAGLCLALLVNVVIFFSPLVDRPASRGELMLFALPDAAVVLAARIVSYRVTDVHQRAMRQQMILGFVVAVAFCAALFTLTLLHPGTAG